MFILKSEYDKFRYLSCFLDFLGKKHMVYKVSVCMGTVGALAPSISESVSAGTHAFWLYFLTFPSIFTKMIWKML